MLELNTSQRIQLFHFIKIYLGYQSSLKIKSKNNISLEKFKAISQSALFELEKRIIIQENLNNHSYANKLFDSKGSFSNKIYKSELVSLYQQSKFNLELPDHRFLLLYRILEYFFTEAKDKIQKELFKEPLSDSCKKLKQKIKINELTCLEYVLKFIDILTIKDELYPTAINYFNSTSVPFTKNDNCVDLRTSKSDIIPKLTKRIYETRNAVVHNKKDETGYTIFKDELALKKECILLEIIAEKLIKISAEPIDFDNLFEDSESSSEKN